MSRHFCALHIFRFSRLKCCKLMSRHFWALHIFRFSRPKCWKLIMSRHFTRMHGIVKKNQLKNFDSSPNTTKPKTMDTMYNINIHNQFSLLNTIEREKRHTPVSIKTVMKPIYNIIQVLTIFFFYYMVWPTTWAWQVNVKCMYKKQEIYINIMLSLCQHILVIINTYFKRG